MIAGLIVITVYCIVLVVLAELRGICHKIPGIHLGRKLMNMYCIDLFFLLSSSSATILFTIFTGNNCFKESQKWWRLIMVPLWMFALIINNLPLQLVGFAFVGYVIILFGKFATQMFCA